MGKSLERNFSQQKKKKKKGTLPSPREQNKMAVAMSVGMMGVLTRTLQECGLYLPKLDDICDPRP